MGFKFDPYELTEFEAKYLMLCQASFTRLAEEKSKKESLRK